MVTVDVAGHVAASEFTQLSDVFLGVIFCVPTCPNLSLQPLHWCLSSAWMCTWECVFEGQRSQSCPMTTEFLKNPWPPCWSCRATVYWATTSHHSQMLKGCEGGFSFSQKKEEKINFWKGRHVWVTAELPQSLLYVLHNYISLHFLLFRSRREPPSSINKQIRISGIIVGLQQGRCWCLSFDGVFTWALCRWNPGTSGTFPWDDKSPTVVLVHV